MAIPYPSEIFRPYVFEPIGAFLNAWGEPVLFPIAHWMAWVTIGLCMIMMTRSVVAMLTAGSAAQRAEAAIARWHAQKEAQTNQFGENQQRK